MINEVGFDLKHEKVQLYGSTSISDTGDGSQGRSLDAQMLVHNDGLLVRLVRQFVDQGPYERVHGCIGS
jgi:hypothetical protein